LKPRYPVVLASGSPRRKHLLAQIFAEFDIVIPNIDESIQAAEPEQAALDIAERKARTVFAQRPDSLVIAADTIVVFQKMILNKPDNEAHAVQMLTQLSGSCHTVITAVALLWPQGAHSFAESSIVEFRRASPSEIEAYVKTGEPMDKAGAYGIQGMGGTLVTSVEGDYDNVVGLPLNRLKLELVRLNLL